MHIFNISVFGFQIAPTWYGFMYACGFIICYQFMKKNVHFHKDDLDSLLFYIFLGVIFGGRIGYITLYNPTFFISNPIEILSIWKGGMSFHGGFLGVVLATFIFCRTKKYQFWNIIDHLAIIIPIALGLGRIGNYINKELLGYAPYEGPFSIMVNGISYFPSTLLEMTLEGILLFIIMIFTWKYITKSSIQNLKKPGILSGVFLLGYSMARLISEQFRLPDAHVGYLFGTDWITLGITYTLPMLITGIIILYVQICVNKSKN